jgi:hypothetical protein
MRAPAKRSERARGRPDDDEQAEVADNDGDGPARDRQL